MGCCLSRPAVQEDSVDEIPLQPSIPAGLPTITLPDSQSVSNSLSGLQPYISLSHSGGSNSPIEGEVEYSVTRHGFDRVYIMRALSLLGSYLTFNETNLELVAREGIVSVLKFQIESHCREIGCYGSEADRKTLCDATKYVHAMRRTHGIPELPKNWFTLHQVNMKQESFVSAMIQDAESSPYEIFKQGGLTLIAQPFDMLFCEAVDRAGREASSVSRNLAVRYLSEYIETHNNTPIASGQIRGWSMKYKKGWVIGVLNEIDIMYREQYGGTGIVWSGNEG